jgi:hypothetical protein
MGGLIWFRAGGIFRGDGPGFITANVDNDPGGILTYSQAAPNSAIPCSDADPHDHRPDRVQEMAARMGAVTGRGSRT